MALKPSVVRNGALIHAALAEFIPPLSTRASVPSGDDWITGPALSALLTKRTLLAATKGNVFGSVIRFCIGLQRAEACWSGESNRHTHSNSDGTSCGDRRRSRMVLQDRGAAARLRWASRREGSATTQKANTVHHM